MAVQLERVIPFGRSFDEYQKMFKLSESDLQQRILGVGDGPASFNAEATQLGYRVVSIDPIYQFSGEEILQRFNEVLDDIIDQVKATASDYVWSYHQSPDDLRNNRINVIQRFIRDYEKGKREKRYQPGALPDLGFIQQEFDIALCSHFLFLYSDHLDRQFHQAAVAAMLNVSSEVRIFPLLTLMLDRSPHLESVIQQCLAQGYVVEIEQVPYEFQKGGNQMLRIRKPIVS